MLIPFVVKPYIDNNKHSPEDTFKKVLEIIQTKRSAVFCGAGISFASGLPIVASLLSYIFSKLELTVQQINLINNSNLPFESIMEMILRESGLDEIQELFSRGEPNCNHILIAKLAEKKYINLIYTTNFDTLIEKSLEAEGLIAGKDFKVYSSETAFNSIVWEDKCIKVVKIHGCVSKREDMAITMSLIASDRYSKVRKDLLHKIFCADQCDHVIVLGYSCSDLDLTPLIESFKGKTADILFIEHENSSAKVEAEAVSVGKNNNPFRNYKGLRLRINTDKLVRKIWGDILTDKYISKTVAETDWKQNIDSWYRNSIQDSGEGVKHHIAGRLLYAIGEFKEAIEHNSKAIAIASRDGNMIAYSSEVGNLGMAFNASGDYKLAISCFEESIPLCKRIGNLENLAAQLQSFGNVLHHAGDDIEALEKHKEALKYAEAEKDDFLISNILGNMSNSYNRLGQFNDALVSLDNALILSRQLGNKQAESSQLGIMAITYLLMEHYDEALKYCLQGLEIKVAIADRHGECIMLGNLVEIYRLRGQIHLGLETAERCLILALSIGNISMQQILKVNIALLNSLA